MADRTDGFVPTALGRLHVTRQGTGPVTVFWHSLFLDSRSWAPLTDALDALAPHRAVVTVDGPSHGRSEPVHRDFTFDECTRAAGEVLDGLGIAEPVDWVGNAWGGHVGILLAATQSRRIRTLTTIGTPVPALSTRFRWAKAWPLVALYRWSGPTRFLSVALSDALLGPEAVAAQPDQAYTVIDAFRCADRTGMLHAMRSMMLKRPDLSEYLPRVTAPTLMLAARDDDEGWPVAQAESACATMRNARAGVLSGSARVAPLLLDPELIARTLLGFWSEVAQDPAHDVEAFGQ
ncbi:alpha/beta fold hydrolase [Mycobacterium kansasii]|uniref:Haloalkane dehalogenase n=2 Tax=Mycobacterium kansasii TaxID=1768 RepID=A0A653EKU7_MYCKA|nr:alpha/beta hydrolase [Mycobacterium kansasii]AGZ53398.1 hydrolase [Mycobacterium kansasii ATCC 12478]ARG54995.1 alpha/beta hydrolase [Mycobacterium kansasii]ARG60446.1 alpha/beta hydrolase [Mycobacterium kansasii]ARG68128.1 alpha/beta hydrolase [Mycobacterium kansasii]ARG77230.1 alpha/beta hydrolase [Mycobacterium kansasii]